MEVQTPVMTEERLKYRLLTEILNARGISEYEMCKRAGITQATVTNWKKKGSITIRTLLKLMDACEITFRHLDNEIILTDAECIDLMEQQTIEDTRQTAKDIFNRR